MRESEWLECTDPQRMLEFLRGRASDRKLRLFAVACARPIAQLVGDPRVADAVNIAEKFADGLVGDAERSQARKAAQQAAQVKGTVARPTAPKWERRAASLAYYATAREAAVAAWNMHDMTAEVLYWRAGNGSYRSEVGVRQSGLLREVFGNVARTVILDRPCLSSTILNLTKTIYDERSFDLLPILADALEESGCCDVEILTHLRGTGPHTRGCWVVDMLLGKE